MRGALRHLSRRNHDRAAHTSDQQRRGDTKGQLILTIDEHVTSHEAGEWYHVPAGVEHAARFDTDSAEIEFWFER